MSTTSPDELETFLTEVRRALLGYCYRMLGSPFDAEDAVQETMLRAWRASERLQEQSARRAWVYRIATNVCLDAIAARGRRARPVDLGPAGEPVEANLRVPSEVSWLEPIPDGLAGGEDPAERVQRRETLKMAFVAALQHLPARQRAALILCEVLRFKATEVADLLGSSVSSVNSSLQRARATLELTDVSPERSLSLLTPGEQALLGRYVTAFEAYDFDALTLLIREDAVQSMPPYDLWLARREDIFRWWQGPGIDCQHSRLVSAPPANQTVAFGQYKPAPGGGHEPWALQVLELDQSGISELTFFLATERLFPLFGLPAVLD